MGLSRVSFAQVLWVDVVLRDWHELLAEACKPSAIATAAHGRASRVPHAVTVTDMRRPCCYAASSLRVASRLMGRGDLRASMEGSLCVPRLTITVAIV